MHKCNCGEIGHIYVGRPNRYYCDLCFDKYYQVPKGIKAQKSLLTATLK